MEIKKDYLFYYLVVRILLVTVPIELPNFKVGVW